MEVLAQVARHNRGAFVQQLRSIRSLDHENHGALEKIKEDQNSLLEHLQAAIKEGRDIDEADLLQQVQALSERTSQCIAKYELQHSLGHHLYEQLDKQINYMCECRHLCPAVQSLFRRKHLIVFCIL
jgi:seryl-tRNA synthetase